MVIAGLTLVAGFAPLAATAQDASPRVFPPQAATVSTVNLSDLIVEALPVAGADLLGWDHLVDAQVLWITNGYDSTASGAERIGLARVRVAGRTSTLLRQRREELAWTITLETAANPKFGPQKVEIRPGAPNQECFGSLTDNCAFTEQEALANPRLSRQLICRVTPGGFPLAVYRVAAPGKAPGYVRVWTSGGSGGVASSVTVSLEALDCSY